MEDSHTLNKYKIDKWFNILKIIVIISTVLALINLAFLIYRAFKENQSSASMFFMGYLIILCTLKLFFLDDKIFNLKNRFMKIVLRIVVYLFILAFGSFLIYLTYKLFRPFGFDIFQTHL